MADQKPDDALPPESAAADKSKPCREGIGLDPCADQVEMDRAAENAASAGMISSDAEPSAPATSGEIEQQDRAGAGMEIHRPRAAHSWREFLIEIGTIVVGILIALGLEQSIEAFHERQLAREAGDAIDAEMGTDLDLITSRLSRQPCIDRRLDQIAALLKDWKSGKAPPGGLTLGDPGDAPLIDQRWRANLNSGRFSQQS